MGKGPKSDIQLRQLGYESSKEICLRCLYHVQMYNPQAKCWRNPNTTMCVRCRDIGHKCVKVDGVRARRKLKELQTARKMMRDAVDTSRKAEFKAQIQNMASVVRKAHARNQLKSKSRKSHEELLLDGIVNIGKHLRILSKCMLKIATVNEKDIAPSDDSDSDEEESDSAEDEVDSGILD